LTVPLHFSALTVPSIDPMTEPPCSLIRVIINLTNQRQFAKTIADVTGRAVRQCGLFAARFFSCWRFSRLSARIRASFGTVSTLRKAISKRSAGVPPSGMSAGGGYRIQPHHTAESDTRLLALRNGLADPDYWPPASSAEEELTFAMFVKIGSFSITGQSPGEIRTDLIREEKRRRLLWPMPRLIQSQILSEWDRYGVNLSAFDTTLQGLLLALDSAVLPSQASPENRNAQSPVCSTDPPSGQTGRGQL